MLLFAVPWVAAQAPEASSRVLREASNPMRMIIEAAKIKPRPRPADKPAPRAAAAPASAPAAPDEAAEPAVAVAASPAAPALPPPGPPESRVTTVEVDAPAGAEAPAPAPEAKVETRAEARVEPAAPQAEPVPLQLASMVEPVTPRALQGLVRGDVRTHVAFTVQTDGSVRDAAVRTSTHPRMDAAVLAAVSQWRYQPIAAPRAHEVLVVLRHDE